MNVVAELIKLGVVGLIAGLFSSVLANRDYRYRKWWELRVNAYQGAIEALSDVVYYFDRHYNAELLKHELSSDAEQQISDFWDEAYPKVRRLADSGAFLFSDRANAALKEFMGKESEPSYYEYLDNNLAKSRACLDELVTCSKVDLRLKEGFVERWLP